MFYVSESSIWEVGGGQSSYNFREFFRGHPQGPSQDATFADFDDLLTIKNTRRVKQTLLVAHKIRTQVLKKMLPVRPGQDRKLPK